MSRAVLSIGSNSGDRLGHLQSVVDGLGTAVRAVSAVYETAPWGGVPQPDFLNAVLLAVSPGVAAEGWLAIARQLEVAAGREREVRWGPRSLDVDLIAVDDLYRTDPELTLPHPWAHQRAFVLLPWLDVDPQAVLPGAGPVRALVDRLDPAERAGVRRRDDLRLRPPAPAGRDSASTGMDDPR